MSSKSPDLDVNTICNYNHRIEYEWDARKRRANIRKHGFDFRDAPLVLDGVTLTILDDREDYGEERFVTLGLLQRTVVVIAHTEQHDVIRVISMRKATENEEIYFFAQVGDELETDLGHEG